MVNIPDTFGLGVKSLSKYVNHHFSTQAAFLRHICTNYFSQNPHYLQFDWFVTTVSTKGN